MGLNILFSKPDLCSVEPFYLLDFILFFRLFYFCTYSIVSKVVLGLYISYFQSFRPEIGFEIIASDEPPFRLRAVVGRYELLLS